MLQVVKFETRDGKIFDCKAEAQGHEAVLDSLTKFAELLKTSIQTGRPEAIIRHLISEHAAVISILKCHAKKLPRS